MFSPRFCLRTVLASSIVTGRSAGGDNDTKRNYVSADLFQFRGYITTTNPLPTLFDMEWGIRYAPVSGSPAHPASSLDLCFAIKKPKDLHQFPNANTKPPRNF